MPADVVERPDVVERRVATERGNLYVRDYPGQGPAFVLMHGFPDHLGIYEALVPHLSAGERRVVTFDFLGFGQSEQPDGAVYTFPGQLAELEAVALALDLGRFVPVAHDSSGPAAINFALAHPDDVAELIILNAGYDDASPVHWPDMITLFATDGLAELSGAIAQSPEQFGWLLGWQRERFSAKQPPEQRERFNNGVAKLIADNFAGPRGSGPAFLQLASRFHAELARNAKRLPELRGLGMPVKVIWGELDPYLDANLARHFAGQFTNASLRLLPAGHWLQADMPERVAQEMLT
ncbi:MAG: alpha/beta fold hydrolase [Thermohalobaculum sp.]